MLIARVCFVFCSTLEMIAKRWVKPQHPKRKSPV